MSAIDDLKQSADLLDETVGELKKIAGGGRPPRPAQPFAPKAPPFTPEEESKMRAEILRWEQVIEILWGHKP